MSQQDSFLDFMEGATVQHTSWDIKEQYVMQITVQPNTIPNIVLAPWNPYQDQAFASFFPQSFYPVWKQGQFFYTAPEWPYSLAPHPPVKQLSAPYSLAHHPTVKNKGKHCFP